MNIQSLLCSQKNMDANTMYSVNEKYSTHSHERQFSWNSSPTFSAPSSPATSSSTSSLYSIPSSPEIEVPSSPVSTSILEIASQRNTVVKNSIGQTRIPWSSEEDQLLQQGFSQGLSWAMISTIYLPHRSRGCCWGRFKTLQSKYLEQKEWTESEDRLLLLAIKKHSKLFKQAWKAVAQDTGNRSWKECELRSTKVNHSNMIRKKQQHSHSRS